MSGGTPSTVDVAKKTPGLTDLLARVLEQLSVSAWLPAAMLIGVSAILVQLKLNGDLDIARAVGDLANPQSWGIIIILLFGLVLTTMVTQAFSFGIIRLLEGYWGAEPPMGWLVQRRVNAQAKRADALRNRTIQLERQLFQSAIGKLAGEDPLHVQVWNEQLYVPKKERKQTDRAIIQAANAIDWRKKGDPGLAARFYRSHDRHSDYPDEATRILPTRLGNVLRSAEEQLGLKGHALERFIMENYSKIPARLMSQHDQFRDRLDMYALLVLVFTAMASASVALLWDVPWPHRWLPSFFPAFAVLSVLGWMSYQAAIASARGYGSTLLAINRVVENSISRQSTQQTVESAVVEQGSNAEVTPTCELEP